MLDWILDPFSWSYMQRALIAGLLVAVLCACVGTWVVQRGLAFLGDALGHGLLPGVAIAHLVGANLILGAAASAVVMIAGISYVSGRTRLSADTSIGLLFVGALALGVIVVSRSRSFAIDVTAFLFGDVLAASRAENWWLAGATLVVIAASIVLYRPFVALCLDARKALTLGFHPRLAHTVMLAMVAVAVVASFRVVGTLLVFGFLIAPPSTALLLVRHTARAMAVAAACGALSVVAGLLVSWHHATAAGATIALCAIALFWIVLVGRGAARRLAAPRTPRHSTGAATGRVVTDADELGVDDLSVHYGEHAALTGASVSFPAGTSTALIGPNGAGKSTLLNVLAGIMVPSGGTAHTTGRPAYVLQHNAAPPTLPLSVRETVAMGVWADRGMWRPLGESGKAVVAASMERLQISDLADRQLSELSGGQRQRAFVAQALAQRAGLLLLDEPVAGVDALARRHIGEAIEAEASRGVTVVTSTHDLADAASSDQVVLLVDGRQHAVGAPNEVLRPTVLAEVYGHVVTLGNGDQVLVLPVAEHAATDPAHRT